MLLFDQDERVRDGFRKLLATSGVVVTATAEPHVVASLAEKKFFAAAVVDLDTPGRGEGLTVLEDLKRLSPSTAVVLLCARQTFSAAVDGYRRGAADVVAKSPQNVAYLNELVLRLCRQWSATRDRDLLMAEVLQAHEEFLKRVMEASRRATEAEERAEGRPDPDDVSECVVLVVDDNAQTATGLESALSSEGSYRVISLQTGGAALDFVGQQRFHLALVKDGLPDLPSRTVAKSLRAESDDGIVVLYSHPSAERPGRADIIEIAHSIELIAELQTGRQLVERVPELREGFIAKARERRYLHVFRRDHYDFLKRYVELRQKLLLHVPEGLR